MMVIDNVKNSLGKIKINMLNKFVEMRREREEREAELHRSDAAGRQYEQDIVNIESLSLKFTSASERKHYSVFHRFQGC